MAPALVSQNYSSHHQGTKARTERKVTHLTMRSLEQIDIGEDCLGTQAVILPHKSWTPSQHRLETAMESNLSCRDAVSFDLNVGQCRKAHNFEEVPT